MEIKRLYGDVWKGVIEDRHSSFNFLYFLANKLDCTTIELRFDLVDTTPICLKSKAYNLFVCAHAYRYFIGGYEDGGHLRNVGFVDGIGVIAITKDKAFFTIYDKKHHSKKFIVYKNDCRTI